MDNINDVIYRYNSKTIVNEIPKKTIAIFCDNQNIVKLMKLPGWISVLTCGFNQLEKLDNLPPNLSLLYCINNKITKLVNLPNTLHDFCCRNNPVYTTIIKSEIKYKPIKLKSITTDYLLNYIE
jgi:hypothetical protein